MDQEVERVYRDGLYENIDQIKSDGVELPNLRIEPPPWEGWLNELADWIRDLFPSASVSPESAFTTGQIIKYLFYGMITIVLLIIVWRLVVIILENRGLKPSRAGRVQSANKEFIAPDMLNELLASKQWRLALRYRWKLFLGMIGHKPSVTPQELLGSNDVYPFMFGNEEPQQSTYDQWDDELRQREQQ